MSQGEVLHFLSEYPSEWFCAADFRSRGLIGSSGSQVLFRLRKFKMVDWEDRLIQGVRKRYYKHKKGGG